MRYDDIGKQSAWKTLVEKSSKYRLHNLTYSYLNRYILCFLKAQHKRVGSVKGSLLSLAFAAAEGIFLTFLLP